MCMSYHGKTLAVLLCMHRSGSSLSANVFQELGMSLGPFPMAGGSEFNKYGYFEAVPICNLSRNVQEHVYGFPDDLPSSPEEGHRLRAGRGDWDSSPESIPEEFRARGRELIEELVQSGPVAGFKDPRTALLWPFWNRVIAGFPGLRVVLVMLLRPPHEIAMSLFVRGKGKCSFSDALDLTAIHLHQLGEIWKGWQGDRARVRFVNDVFSDDLRQAAELCGLSWQQEVLARAYDPACKHFEPVVVEHEAQRLYDGLSGLAAPDRAPDRARRMERDAMIRENTLREELAACRAEAGRFQTLAEVSWQEATQLRSWSQRWQQEKLQLGSELEQSRTESGRLRSDLERSGQEIGRLGTDLERSSQEIGRLRSDLERSRQEISRQGSELELSWKEISRQGSQLELSWKEIGRQGSELESSRTEIDRRGSALELSRSEIERLGGEIGRQAEAIRFSHQQIAAAQAALEEGQANAERARKQHDLEAGLWGQEKERLEQQICQYRERLSAADRRVSSLLDDLATTRATLMWRLRTLFQTKWGLRSIVALYLRMKGARNTDSVSLQESRRT
jgi:hypothetical protein